MLAPAGSDARRLYAFVKGSSDGRKELKALLGGKGANLCKQPT
jgi:hypothetical protein